MFAHEVHARVCVCTCACIRYLYLTYQVNFHCLKVRLHFLRKRLKSLQIEPIS